MLGTSLKQGLQSSDTNAACSYDELFGSLFEARENRCGQDTGPFGPGLPVAGRKNIN